MADLNSMTITGRLTKDAVFKVLPTGKGLLTMDVANNTGYGDYKKTLFVKVQQWGPAGKNIQPYLKKGTFVGCEGKASLNEWDGNDGQRHTQLVIDTYGVQLLGSRNNAEDGNAGAAEQDNSSLPEDIPF